MPRPSEHAAAPRKRANKFPTAEPFLPERISIASMAGAAQACRGCDLYKNATQVVFGEGTARARCVMIGEQPGNEEDLQGKPFVGPAGKLLRKALDDAGLARTEVYLTNAVKHFKNEQVGKRRKHKSPNSPEVHACRPWLEQELSVIKPEVVVCLGVTAAKSIMGRNVTLKELRGGFVESRFSSRTIVTMHPSAILRSRTDEDRRANYDALVADLKLAAEELSR